MKRRILSIILAISLLLFTSLTGCRKGPIPPGNSQPTQGQQSPQKPDNSNETDNNTSETQQPLGNNQNTNLLAGLLPLRAGYQWVYFGIAEYGHKMVLNKRIYTKDKAEYQISGTVDDMSGGEAGRGNFFTLSYVAEKGVITQTKNVVSLMDSDFDKIELIRLPFKNGTSWSQKVKGKNGKFLVLDCTITDITNEGGLNIYTIYYKQRNGQYFEKRKIKEGVGVLYFEKLMMTENDSFVVSYSINYSLTGYITNMAINKYLPKLNKGLRYYGLAEYGHRGTFKKLSSSIDSAVYEFNGIYDDGSGIENKFKVQYFINYVDGIIKERVISNTKNSKAEINSKLNDLIILKFPLKSGGVWTQKIKIDGHEYSLRASIIEYNKSTGRVTVRYRVDGVQGYYKNIYIEERTFENGLGLVSFSMLLPGDIGISSQEANDSKKIEEAIKNHMFGYSLSKR